MKILYAIQGTGNGHLSRARDIIPILQAKGDLDLLVSGTQADVNLPHKIKYRLKGIGFVFGKNGGVDIWNTLLNNNFFGIVREIKNLPIKEYDLIINDFEPISAWAARLKKKSCTALSHQCAVLSKNAPVPIKKDRLGHFILKHYAPAKIQYGFHFERFDENIYTPVIRKQVRESHVSNKGHYTVYLPSYSDKKLIKILGAFEDVKWQVFSKHSKGISMLKNIYFRPIDNRAFIKSMASSAGILCGAGFETPAEALFLKKKLMVVPMKNQYEQHCNAAALKKMGVPVLKNLKKKHLPLIENWIHSKKTIDVFFPDNTKNIIDMLVQNHIDPKMYVSNRKFYHRVKKLENSI